jgi:LPS sulfotransferase NodH
MQDQMPPDRLHDKIFGNSFIIGLYRRDFAAQVISWIISVKTDRWHKRRGLQIKIPPDLKISVSEIHRYAPKLYEQYQSYIACGSFMDIELCYEDLLPDLGRSDYVKMPKPDAYEEYVKAVREILEPKGFVFDE